MDVQKTKIKKFLLESVGSAKKIAVDSLIEASEREFEYNFSRWGRKYSLRSYIPTAVNRLVARDLLAWHKKGNKWQLSITSKGEEELSAERLRHYRLPKHSKWDGKWRVIIFDIFERRRGARDLLRAQLRNLGFVKLQASVWLYPYDCKDLVALLGAEIKAGKGIVYLTVDRFDGDIVYRKHFALV